MGFIFDTASGDLPYRLTNDMLFHIVMSRSTNCLKHLLASILSLHPEEITDIRILNPIDYYNKVNAKLIVLDIKLEMNHTALVDIEMQVLRQAAWDKRVLFYSSRLISDQQVDREYRNVKSVYQIGILNFVQPENNAFYRCYRMTSKDGSVFSDDFQIHTMNLKNIRQATEDDSIYGRILWGRMLSAETWEEIHALAGKNPIFREAGEIMGRAMSTEDEILRRREDAIRDYEFGIAGARTEGRNEGLAEGLTQGLSQGRLEQCTEDIQSLMNSLKLTAQQAMDALKVPWEEREILLHRLKNE